MSDTTDRPKIEDVYENATPEERDAALAACARAAQQVGDGDD